MGLMANSGCCQYAVTFLDVMINQEVLLLIRVPL